MTGPAKTAARSEPAVAADNALTAPRRHAPHARTVTDADAGRAAMTARLLDTLAAQLGFRLTDARVRVDAEAGRRTGSRGARGLMADGTIWLHPGGYDPATPSGRALLAHEAVHVAQRSLPPHRRDPAAANPVAADPATADLAAAEAEATRAATFFAEGRLLSRPVFRLAGGATAADTGAATLPESRTGTPAEPVAPPTIGDAYAADIAAIRDRLQVRLIDGIDDAHVSFVLTILEQYPLGTATAVMRAVGQPYRERLADQLSDGQRRGHRQAVLACYGAMSTAERGRRSAHLLDGMQLSDLPPAEHATVIGVLLDASDNTLTELLGGPLRGAVLALMQTPIAAGTAAQAREQARAALVERVAAGTGFADDRTLQTTIKRAGELLATGGLDRVHAALDVLRPLLPGPAPAGTRAPTDRPRSEMLAHVVESLDRSAAVERLIDTLPDDERVEGNRYGDVLLEVIRHRAVAANLAALQQLLSFGFLDWLLGRRGGKAWLAYQIVRRLPPEDQQRWRRLDNGRWFRRLEDNIPDSRRDGYEGVVLEPDPDGRLVDVASRIADTLATPEGREALTAFLAACRDGIDQAHSPGLLLRFNAIGERITDRTRRTELQHAIAVRLDQLGLLGAIVAALPDRWLFEIENVDLLRRISALRDPEHLRRQVYDLIRRNWWRQVPIIGILAAEWSVSARDAFLAFQLARTLPEADRRELEASGHWDAMVSALTPEMRHASGAHLFADPGGQERDRITERLRDDRMWRADRAAELRTLVRMAIELGRRRFVFDRSRATRAFAVPELRPMVEAFGLYAEPGRTEYQAERLPIPEAPQDLWGVLRNAAGWLWVKLRALGSILGSLRFGVNGVGAQDLDLTEVQRLLGGELGPAVLAEQRGDAADLGAPSRTGGGAAAARGRSSANRLTLLYNPRDGVLWFELPDLEIAVLNRIGAGLGVKTNKIKIEGLRAWATFPAQRLDQPTSVRLSLTRAEIVDLLVTGDDLLVAIARLVLRQLDLNLSRTGIDEPIPAPPGSDYRMPIPLVGPIISFVVDVVRRLDYVGRTRRATAQLQGLQATIAGIEFEGIAYGSAVTARSARVENVFLGIGLNRSAYLRALREVLGRRLARAVARGADPATTSELQRRIADTDRALHDLAGPERRLADLHRKYVRDPESLTADERREAAALERELPGGAVVDIGRLEVQGVGGDARLDRLALTGVSGDVAAPAFGPGTAPLTSVFVTDAERIAAFRARGPEAPGGASGPAPLQVRAEVAVATGLSYVGEIPSHAALSYQLDRLPPGTPEENRRRLADLAAAVGHLEDLDARAHGRTEPALTADDRRELDLLRERLQREFGFRAAEVRAKGIGADLLLGPQLGELALHGGDAETVTATDVSYGGYFRAERVTGRGIGGTPLRRQAERPGGADRRSIGFHADELRATGAVLDWAGNRAAEIAVTGLVGELEPRRPAPGQPVTGYRIPSLTAAAATVAGIDYRTDSMWVHSDGVTRITGISLAAEFSRTPDGSVTRVLRLHLDRVSADRLILERNGSGLPFRAEVTSGSLLNIDVQDYVFASHAVGPAEQQLPRRVELGGLDQLRFSVALGALGGGSGVLSSVTETGAPRRTGLLVVQAITDSPQGGEQIDLTGLLLTGGELHTPNGRVAIRRLALGASVHHSGDTWTVRNLAIPELRLGALRWRTADGAELSSTGGVGLTGLSTYGSITAPAGGPLQVHVDELRIDTISAEQLRYRQDPIDITVERRPGPVRSNRPPLEIRDIRLRDLGWSSDRGIGSGTLDVGSAGVEFRGRLAEHLQVDGGVSLTSLHASFTSGGHVVLRARGSADAAVSWEEPGPGPGPTAAVRELSAHLAVNELDTGVVDIGGGAIDFGPGNQPGLQIADVQVNQVDYRSADVIVQSLPGGRGAVFRRPHAKLRIELRNAAERATAGGPEASAIRRILLREVGIDAVELDGIRVTLPTLVAPDPSGATHPVEIWLPPGEVAVLGNLALALPAGGTEITPPPAPGGAWTIPDLHLQILGRTDPASGTRTPALLVPQLRARVAGVLESASARVETERIEVGFLSGGGVTLDLRRPSITAIEAVFRAAPEHSLRIRGLGPVQPADLGGVRAQRVQLDTRTGVLTISQLGVNRLRYVNADAGVEVEVDSATVPGDSRTTLPGVGRTLSGVIPELDIQGASFRVDFTAGPPAPVPTPSRTPWTDLLTRLGPYEQVFDSIQGRIGMTLHQSATGWFRADTPLQLGISNGRLDYNAVQAQLIGGWAGLVRFELRPDVSELWLAIEVPNGNEGMEPTTPIPVAVWRLRPGELVDADRAQQVRIWRLLNLQGALRDKLDTPSAPSSAPTPVELRAIDVDLALRSAGPIPIDLARASRGKVAGTVTLARNALADLRLTGDLPGVLAQRPTGLAQARIDATDVVLTGGAGIRTGAIVVSDVHDLSFTMDSGWNPTLLTGRIGRAVARDITWRKP